MPLTTAFQKTQFQDAHQWTLLGTVLLGVVGVVRMVAIVVVVVGYPGAIDGLVHPRPCSYSGGDGATAVKSNACQLFLPCPKTHVTVELGQHGHVHCFVVRCNRV
jgi:hypothetical protein